MTQELDSSNAGQLMWQEVYESHSNHFRAVDRFLRANIDRTPILRDARRTGNRNVAVTILPYVKIEKLKQLLPDLLFLASYQTGLIEHFRNAIIRLPRDWVLAHIDAEAEPLLSNGTDEEYGRLLKLYILLDHGLTRKLAERNGRATVRARNHRVFATNDLGTASRARSASKPLIRYLSADSAPTTCRYERILRSSLRPAPKRTPH